MCKTAEIMFDEFWKSYNGGRYTRGFFPKFFKQGVHSPSINRFSEKFYYRLAFFQNFLNEFQFYINKSDSPNCRFCHNFLESGHHIFCKCDVLDHSDLILACARENVCFSFANLITTDNLKVHVEKFINLYFLKEKK